MSTRALKHFGFGGGVVDTALETWHSIEAIHKHFVANVENWSAWLFSIFQMDEAILLGILTLIGVLICTWLPIVAMFVKRVAPSVEVPVLSLGLFGATVNSILMTKYAVDAAYVQFHEATNMTDLGSRFMEANDATRLGLLAYLMLVVATWTPIWLLMKRRLARTGN